MRKIINSTYLIAGDGALEAVRRLKEQPGQLELAGTLALDTGIVILTYLPSGRK